MKDTNSKVSRPVAIVITDENGNKLEPYEEVHIDVDEDNVGTVVEMLGKRKGQIAKHEQQR